MAAAADRADGSNARFQETSWDVVLTAAHGVPSQAETALAALCTAYWAPIYAFLRRAGRDEHDAKDLTQAFFEHLLERETLGRVQRCKGRFRTFLLGALQLFLANERDYRRAQKRGGGWLAISLNDSAAGVVLAAELAHAQTPEWVFETSWARVLLERALQTLREEFAAQGKAQVFAVLARFLTGGSQEISYAEAATRLRVSESAVKTLIHRLRRRYGERLRQEIAQTVAGPHEIDEELRHLRALFARGATPP